MTEVPRPPAARPVLAVRLPNWLGDAVLALRAVDALSHRFADHDLVVLARPWARPLFEARWPGSRWLAAPAAGGRWPAAVPALARLKARTIVLFPPSLSARLHAWAAGVPQRVGLAHEAGDFLLTRTAPRGPRGSRPLEDEYLDLVRVLGAEPQPRRPFVAPANAAEATARALAAVGLDPSAVLAGPRLVVAPGARYGPAKRWPAERFAAAAAGWFAARADAGGGAQGGAGSGHVLIVGGSEDAPEALAVRAASAPGPPRVVSLAGRTDLAALTGLLAGADAVLANDSGVAHLAAALDRPTVVVFGSTDPRWTAPRGAHVRVLVDPPACAPCFRRTCAVLERYRCLRAVTAEAAVRALLDATGRDTGATRRDGKGIA